MGLRRHSGDRRISDGDRSGRQPSSRRRCSQGSAPALDGASAPTRGRLRLANRCADCGNLSAVADPRDRSRDCRLAAAAGGRRRIRPRDAAASPSDGARIGDKAWIEIATGGAGVEDGTLAPILFSGEMLRIGRHSDNDIALDHASVHRHHALIQRTPDREFVLVDLTAGTGNVLLLNDRRVDRSAGLRDGDRIMLGETAVGSLAPVASKSTNRPSRQSSRETMHAERDASDEATGRAADRVETRRLNAADRIAARRADRGRS